MDRDLLKRNLAVAESHVAQGERLIAEQRARIADFESRGLKAKRSKLLLATLQESQALHIADRDRLRAELS
jgi:hypothetical protein